MKSELSHLKFLCSEFDVGNVCPACPKVLYCIIILKLLQCSLIFDGSLFIINIFLQETGTVILSMDALFGLPRKKSSGVSHHEPLTRNTYFLPQEEVDNFVNHQSITSYDNVK